MNNLNRKADISTRKISRTFKYDKTPVLTLNIEYPSIVLPHGSSIQSRINMHYNNYARNFYRYAQMTMLPNAIEQYKEAKKNGYPFNLHEAMMVYTVTLNDNCKLSTFFDKYEYTGGAHGITIRSSNSWNLQTGHHIKMADLFEGNRQYRKTVIREIQEMADKEYAENPGIYFENYKQLIEENFSTQNYNLTPHNLDVYYQQYEIAPYATGIVVFSIPYESLGIKKPSCFERY